MIYYTMPKRQKEADLNAHIGTLARNIIVCGHFGSGKTNVSVGLALGLGRGSGALVDLDIVNPYFRAADAAPLMKDAGIDCLVPQYANTNVDIPSLGGEIYSVFAKEESNPEYRAVFDVGGDSGAAALGRFREYFFRFGYSMIFVVSMYRPLTADPESAVADLREIEAISRLAATHIINNSNIGKETTAADIAASIDYAKKISELTGLPLLCTTLHNREFCDSLSREYPGLDFLPIPDSTRRLF